MEQRGTYNPQPHCHTGKWDKRDEIAIANKDRRGVLKNMKDESGDKRFAAPVHLRITYTQN